MDEEMAALDANVTWELVALPKDKKAIGCKWVYKVKHNADGSVSRYKARLVAKGYTQTYGIDYEETYSPLAKMTTVRAIIAMVLAKGWSLLFFMEIYKKKCTWNNHQVMWTKHILIWFVG
jgi:hypothetical protein